MKHFALAAITLVVCAGAQAASDKVEINLVTSQGIGQSIGTVNITETDKGLEFTPDLKALPHQTAKHEGPEGMGHTGDLPVLVVNNDGKATEAVVAPRLKKLDDVKGKALMIHVGGDNMSDQPKPLGGGGARYACGVI